ncbi:MAG: LPS export ABC transporter permease LptF [Alphaproteobacteria bacterium]|nr:LPS export ABC transporter permease LptF [Alphaproteobacteria bacterium]
MNTVDRYIFRQLAIVTLMVTLTLTCAIWLTQSLRFVELIVNRGLTIGTFFYLTMLLLPSFLWIMLPIALFTAVVFAYNRLVGDSELVVMRSAGMGPMHLARPALALAGGIAAISYSLALYFLPLAYRDFKDLEFDVRNDYAGLLLREGAFNTVAPGITVYVRQREASGDLVGILVHDNRRPSDPVTLVAERGRLAVSEDGPRVVLVAGNRQELDRDTGRMRFLYFERYSVDLGRVAQRTTERWREPRERYLHEIFRPPQDENDRQFRSRLLAEGHNRIVTPLLAVTLTLIALACLLSGDFNRRGQMHRVVLAIAAAIAVQTMAVAANNLMTKWPSLAGLAYANVLVPALVAAWWIFRGRGGGARDAAAIATPA